MTTTADWIVESREFLLAVQVTERVIKEHKDRAKDRWDTYGLTGQEVWRLHALEDEHIAKALETVLARVKP